MRISEHYGKWLAERDWTFIMTVRRHFKMKDIHCLNMAKRMINKGIGIQALWLALESDRVEGMNHLHIIGQSEGKTPNKHSITMAMGLSKSPKSICYFEEVLSQEDVAYYCSKQVGKNILYYDYLTIGSPLI